MSKFEYRWGDPRVDTRYPLYDATSLGDIPTATLRNLWMARYGSRAVRCETVMDELANNDAEIAQELMNRNLVKHEKHWRLDAGEEEYYYVLEREDADR